MYTIDESFDLVQDAVDQDYSAQRNFWRANTAPGSNILFVGGTEFVHTPLALTMADRNVDSIAICYKDSDIEAFSDLLNGHTLLEEILGIESEVRFCEQNVMTYSPGKEYDVIVMPNSINAPRARWEDRIMCDSIIKLTKPDSIWLISNYADEQYVVDSFIEYASQFVDISHEGKTLQGDWCSRDHQIYRIEKK